MTLRLGPDNCIHNHTNGEPRFITGNYYLLAEIIHALDGQMSEKTICKILDDSRTMGERCLCDEDFIYGFTPISPYGTVTTYQCVSRRMRADIVSPPRESDVNIDLIYNAPGSLTAGMVYGVKSLCYVCGGIRDQVYRYLTQLIVGHKTKILLDGITIYVYKQGPDDYLVEGVAIALP